MWNAAARWLAYKCAWAISAADGMFSRSPCIKAMEVDVALVVRRGNGGGVCILGVC